MRLFTMQVEDSEYEAMEKWATHIGVARSVIMRLALRRLLRFGDWPVGTMVTVARPDEDFVNEYVDVSDPELLPRVLKPRKMSGPMRGPK